ncbi:VOC family protein [Actinophytocola oryzae]|uniref:Putative enzyme related to lactoylglutathione lyase n=1 Tax=Actinophytocola oryzae TaxID=502181 RepID=A0A4R7V7G8_9PSEU|nr:VOC family protein [Actinophytocola oryzae]TDV43626.1 putative enzyme related to lactoylglutathione lyase [Actinophytocola oryzae]
MFRGFATINHFADDMTAAETWYTRVLGTPPYFRRDADGRPAYLEYRIGDYQAELGIIDSRFAPHDTTPGAGVIMHWHVDDLDTTLARLISMGAKELQGITPRGEGFATASVVDPFGNVIGIMSNPHYLEVLATTQPQPVGQ